MTTYMHINPIFYTLLILAATIFLFVTGKIRSDLVAIMSVIALFLGGILTTGQALQGFSDSTVIMITALFVVGEGLSRTGVTSWLSHQIITFAGKNNNRVLVVLMAGTAVLSAFISNTGTVATLLPAVIAIAWSIDSQPSKLLIPLAFAANTGGLLTLTGTPPNIVVSETLTNAGYQPFGYFEYAYIGFPLLIIAITYMIFWGQKQLPERHTGDRPEDLESSMRGMAESFTLQGKLFRAYVDSGSPLVGMTLAEATSSLDDMVSVLRIDQPKQQDIPLSPKRKRFLSKLDQLTPQDIPGPNTVINGHDILTIKGPPMAIQRAAIKLQFSIEEVDVESANLSNILVDAETGVAEILISPRSTYSGQILQQSNLSKKFGIHVISIRRGNNVLPRKGTPLAFGDALLVRGTWKNIDILRQEQHNFTVVGSPDDISRQVITLNIRAIIAVLALVGMITMMVFSIVPTVMAAIIAAVVMVLGGCLDMNQAYRSISWQSVCLIAAMIPMSKALEVTGGADLIANGLVNTLGTIGPLALLIGVFLLTAGFSQVINNTATAVLVSPIVLQAADVSGISPYPLLITVAVSASTAFLTPIGTTTNLMVMTPGGYNFNDYLKVGLPLILLFLLVSIILVPIIWPF